MHQRAGHVHHFALFYRGAVPKFQYQVFLQHGKDLGQQRILQQRSAGQDIPADRPVGIQLQHGEAPLLLDKGIRSLALGEANAVQLKEVVEKQAVIRCLVAAFHRPIFHGVRFLLHVYSPPFDMVVPKKKKQTFYLGYNNWNRIARGPSTESRFYKKAKKPGKGCGTIQQDTAEEDTQ